MFLKEQEDPLVKLNVLNCALVIFYRVETYCVPALRSIWGCLNAILKAILYTFPKVRRTKSPTFCSYVHTRAGGQPLSAKVFFTTTLNPEKGEKTAKKKLKKTRPFRRGTQKLGHRYEVRKK